MDLNFHSGLLYQKFLLWTHYHVKFNIEGGLWCLMPLSIYDLNNVNNTLTSQYGFSLISNNFSKACSPMSLLTLNNRSCIQSCKADNARRTATEELSSNTPRIVSSNVEMVTVVATKDKR